MVRHLISSIVITVAAISVGSAATTENAVESTNIHTKKDEHKKAQAIDDIDTSSKAEPKAVKKKLNNVESESTTVDDNTATSISATKSPWTSFDVPSWLLKTKNFYKIDKLHQQHLLHK